jgi:hypothetical protein
MKNACRIAALVFGSGADSLKTRYGCLGGLVDTRPADGGTAGPDTMH